MQSRPVLAFLFIAVIAFAWSVLGFWGKMRETSKNREIVENKIAELKKKEETFSANIAILQTEAGVEYSIRDKFGWAKEGEGLIVIVDNKSPENNESEKNKGGFFSFFFNWFR